MIRKNLHDYEYSDLESKELENCEFPESLPNPGKGWLIDWSSRTGKSWSCADWIEKVCERCKTIIVVPTLGEPGNPDTGVGATWLKYLKDRDLSPRIAAGKAKTSLPWSEELAGMTPDRIQHWRLGQDLCATCPVNQDLSTAIQAVRDDPSLADDTGFPQTTPYEEGHCPQKVGHVALLTIDYGDVVITTPQTLRIAIQKLQEASIEGVPETVEAWAEDLVIVADEIHKDQLLTVKEDAEIEKLDALENPPTPEVLKRLPSPSSEEGREEMKNRFESLRKELEERLLPVLRVGWFVAKHLTFAHRYRSAIEQARRQAGEGASGKQIASRLRNRFDEDFVPPPAWEDVHDDLQQIFIPSLTELQAPTPEDIDRIVWEPLSDAWNGDDPSADHPLPVADLNPDLHSRMDYLHEAFRAADSEGEDVFSELSDWVSDNLYDLRDLLNLIIRECGNTDRAETWAELLFVLLEAEEGLLYPEYKWDGYRIQLHLKTLDGEIKASTCPDTSNLYTNGFPIHLSWSPLEDALDAGARAIFLSATPPTPVDLDIITGGHRFDRLAYPEAKPNPKLRIAVEMGTRSIRQALDGQPLSSKFRRLLEGIDPEDREVHIVARNKREAKALQDLDIPDERIHYARGEGSVGVKWERTDPDCPLLIVFTGPPNLPPTMWASLQGLTRRRGAGGDSPLIQTSREYQFERMAMEIFQTGCRDVAIPHDEGGEERVGEVVLLAGKHQLEDLKKYGEAVGIEAEWLPVDVNDPMEERGLELARKATGKPYVGPLAREILESVGSDEFSRAKLEQEWDIASSKRTDAIEELLEAGAIRETRKEGKAQYYEATGKLQPA